MKDMRTVRVHEDTGVIVLIIRIAADMIAYIADQHLFVKSVR